MGGVVGGVVGVVGLSVVLVVVLFFILKQKKKGPKEDGMLHSMHQVNVGVKPTFSVMFISFYNIYCNIVDFILPCACLCGGH